MEKEYGVSSKHEKIKLPYDPAIPLWSSYPKKAKVNSNIYIYLIVHCSSVYSSQDMEETYVPVDR